MSDEAEKAFPYVLADNERNRTVFAVGYRAGVESQQQRIRELTDALSKARSEIERRPAPEWRDALIADRNAAEEQLAAVRMRVAEWVDDPTDHVHENRVIDYDRLRSIVFETPESVLAEHDARVLDALVNDDDIWDASFCDCGNSDTSDVIRNIEHRAAEYRKGAGQ